MTLAVSGRAEPRFLRRQCVFSSRVPGSCTGCDVKDEGVAFGADAMRREIGGLSREGARRLKKRSRWRPVRKEAFPVSSGRAWGDQSNGR